MSDEFETIPISDYEELGADPKMPWVYSSSIGDPIVYGEDGKGVVRWAIGQQVRVMYPVRCTRCRGEASVESRGMVSILTGRKESGRGPTEWVTLCRDHFKRHAEQGLV